MGGKFSHRKKPMTKPPLLHITASSTLKWYPQTQTVGISGTSQSYLSFTASRNSFFKIHISNWQNSKPTGSAFLGSKVHSSQRFSRNRALHLIKFFLQILILHSTHLSLHSVYVIFVWRFVHLRFYLLG